MYFDLLSRIELNRHLFIKKSVFKIDDVKQLKILKNYNNQIKVINLFIFS